MSAILALTMALALTACGGDSSSSSSNDSTPAESTPAAPTVEIPPVEDLTGTDTSAIPGLEDGVLTVGMECAYAPYNWTQMDDSNGAVPISNVPGAYANGYDVMIAQRICETYGWELEIVSSAWDSLCPAVQSGTMDANIAGQSMTADRMKEVDMAGPYYYATIVVLTTKDSQYANAASIADLAGGTCTSQSGTIWYDSCLPQQLQVVVRQHRVNGIQPVGEDQPGQQQHRHRQQDLGFRIRRFAADGHACQQADPCNNGQQAHHHTGAAGPRTDRNDLHAVRRNRRDRPSKRIGDLQHTGKCHDAAAGQNPKQPLLVIPVQEP